MNARSQAHLRLARYHHEFSMILGIIVVIAIAGIRMVGSDPNGETRPLWDRALASFLGLMQCFGLVIGISFVLASIEILKQTAARYQCRRIENKLARLDPILHDGLAQATPSNLVRVLRLLRDPHENVRRQAIAAAFTLLRARPALINQVVSVPSLEEAVLEGVSFAQALAATPLTEDLLARVTLGAKLGAGTAEKRLAPVTSIPATLAHWVHLHRPQGGSAEIQVSIGYDTGHLPSLVERSRFLALYFYICTTDHKRFQALLRRPPRDPNAAFGLVIRGDIVEVRAPGQARGHRLDYVFPLPVHLSEANLVGFFHQIQILNLGLLVACAEDACRVLLPGKIPAWLDARRLALGRVYREFERRFVALLRAHDRYRDPSRIHRLNPGDHAERVQAFECYRLEECLYPQYKWVVPLYDPDIRWERLLVPLRGVEAMLLHQGEVEGRDHTRGVEFLHQVRRLGYESAGSLEQVLQGASPESFNHGCPGDPFIDPTWKDATMQYLAGVSRAIARKECSLEQLPDPVTFRQAAAYYSIEGAAEVALIPRSFPEVES
ncbi:MAG: hypothetical protein U0840_14245 [Gemmataceae bacterium]